MMLTQTLHYSAGYHLLQDLTVRVESWVRVHLQQPHLWAPTRKDVTITHTLTSDLCSDVTLPTLKSSSTMKSQPNRSKRPRRRSSLDLTAKKHCVMICCMRLWRQKIHCSACQPYQYISNISYSLQLLSTVCSFVSEIAWIHSSKTHRERRIYSYTSP